MRGDGRRATGDPRPPPPHRPRPRPHHARRVRVRPRGQQRGDRAAAAGGGGDAERGVAVAGGQRVVDAGPHPGAAQRALQPARPPVAQGRRQAGRGAVGAEAETPSHRAGVGRTAGQQQSTRSAWAVCVKCTTRRLSCCGRACVRPSVRASLVVSTVVSSVLVLTDSKQVAGPASGSRRSATPRPRSRRPPPAARAAALPPRPRPQLQQRGATKSVARSPTTRPAAASALLPPPPRAASSRLLAGSDGDGASAGAWFSRRSCRLAGKLAGATPQRPQPLPRPRPAAAARRRLRSRSRSCRRSRGLWSRSRGRPSRPLQPGRRLDRRP